MKKLNFPYIAAMSGVIVLAAFFAPFFWDQWYGWAISAMGFFGIISCRGKRVSFTRIDVLLLICFVCLCSGLVNIAEREQAMRYFRFFILPVPFIYFFSGRCYSRVDQFDVLRVFWTCGLVAGICGIIEIVTRQNIIYRYFFENYYFDVSIGRRLMSFFFHPVVAATYLAGVLPLTVSLFLLENKRAAKAVIAGGIAVILVSVALAFSRAALVALIAGSFFFVYCLKPRWAGRVLALGGAAATSCIVFCSLARSIYWPLARFSVQDISAPVNFIRKFDRAVMAVRMVKDHPWFGVGYDHFRALFDQYSHGLSIVGMGLLPDGKVADCMILTIAAETGLIGLCGFLLFLLGIFLYGLGAVRRSASQQDRIMLTGYLSGLISICCMFMTYETLYWPTPNILFWLYAGIIAYYCGMQRKRA
ncbi:MAG TPA: O-antigen ligase family protein [Candidatus Omnitrophota bacterium]|nr:O-antigen ligase family protein [Candidatus Omnitrophota bacterium]